MIEKIVIVKIVRAAFGKKEPVEVMIGFFDRNGTQVGSQLIAASLLDEDIQEGQAIDFKTSIGLPFSITLK